nr:MAG TPA: hypothetical protein [Caudoviricetes sp.]
MGKKLVLGTILTAEMTILALLMYCRMAGPLLITWR